MSSTPNVEDIMFNSILIAERGPGTFVGESALLAGKRLARRGASVFAVSDVVQTMVLHREDLADVALEFPDGKEMFNAVSLFGEQTL
jgi:CRP-like cAMP-binding protein